MEGVFKVGPSSNVIYATFGLSLANTLPSKIANEIINAATIKRKKDFFNRLNPFNLFILQHLFFYASKDIACDIDGIVSFCIVKVGLIKAPVAAKSTLFSLPSRIFGST